MIKNTFYHHENYDLSHLNKLNNSNHKHGLKGSKNL